MMNKPTEKGNIGGYDINVFYDCQGVNYLERMLLESHRIMPDFKKMDKYPNLDGCFEICEPATSGVIESDNNWKVIPFGKFEVQIKTLNNDYTNYNKNKQSDFKYSCETKAMNYVLSAGTLNPVLLLLVDWINGHIYWKYLSQNYCLELELESKDKKVIYFDRSDEVVDMKTWMNTLKQIRSDLVRIYSNRKENLFVANEPVPAEALEAFGYINDCFDHALKFIKDLMFPDVWKFGIAYIKDFDSGVSYAGIYKIKTGEDNRFVKCFEEDPDGSYIQKIYFGGYTLKDMIQEAIEKDIDDFFDKNSLHVKIMPTFALLEIFYHELDNAVFHEQAADITNEMQGKPFLIGWDKDTVDLVEYEQLLQSRIINDRAMRCVDELVRRGYTEFKRAFEDNPNHIIDISLPIDGEEGYAIHFNPAYDRKELDKRNMKRFLDGVVSLYDEGKKLLVESAESTMKLNGRHVYWISDDYTQCCYKTTESPDFGFEWQIVEKDEFKTVLQRNYDIPLENSGGSSGWCTLTSIDYSWDRLWRAMFKSMALRIIGKNQSVRSLL